MFKRDFHSKKSQCVFVVIGDLKQAEKFISENVMIIIVYDIDYGVEIFCLQMLYQRIFQKFSIKFVCYRDGFFTESPQTAQAIRFNSGIENNEIPK